MNLSVFVSCAFVLALAASAHDCFGALPTDVPTPSACLLQQGGGQLQRATRVEDIALAGQEHKAEFHAHLAFAQKGHADGDVDKEKEHTDYHDPKEDNETNPKGNLSQSDELMKDGSLASLRLELHLQAALSDLPGDVGRLKAGFVKAANISASRLDVLGVRSVDGSSKSLVSTDAEVNGNRQGDEVARGEETVVDLELLPGMRLSEPSAVAAYLKVKEQLGKEKSDLMTGSLKDKLTGAKLVMMQGVQGFFVKSPALRVGGHLVAPALLVAICAPLALWPMPDM